MGENNESLTENIDNVQVVLFFESDYPGNLEEKIPDARRIFQDIDITYNTDIPEEALLDMSILDILDKNGNFSLHLGKKSARFVFKKLDNKEGYIKKMVSFVVGDQLVIVKDVGIIINRLIEQSLLIFKSNIFQARVHDFIQDSVSVSFAKKVVTGDIGYNINCNYRFGTKNINKAQAFLVTLDVNTKNLNAGKNFNNSIIKILDFSFKNTIYKDFLNI